jgi:hypothetical protein
MSHPVFARVDARLRPVMDRQGDVEHRIRLLAGTAGLVVEVGAGEGANFSRYPPEVTEVVAIEPDPYLRGQAQWRASVAMVRRVLRRGGLLRFDEHVAALPRRRVAAGLVIEELERFDFPPGQPSPTAPHMLGRDVREVAS